MFPNYLRLGSFYALFLCVSSIFLAANAQIQADSAQICDENCCSHSVIPTGVMLSHVHPKGEWMFSYRLMRMEMGAMQNGSQTLTDNDVYAQNYSMTSSFMRMDMHMLMAMYGINDKLTLMTMIHYQNIGMHMDMFASDGHNHGGVAVNANVNPHLYSSGIGDTKIYVLYQAFSKNGHKILGNVGLSLPTGSIHKKGEINSMYSNSQMPYQMQMGSGTVDFLPSLSYLLDKNNISFGTQVAGNIRSYKNALNYQLGNEYTLTTWLGYRWFSFLGSSIRFEGITTEKITGFDAQLYAFTEPSTNVSNYGGQKLNGFVGLNYYFNRGWIKNSSVSTEFGLPLYQNFNGIQMQNKFQWLAAFNMAF
jgi:hypothetical protein